MLDGYNEYERLRREERLEWYRKDQGLIQRQYEKLRYWCFFWFSICWLLAVMYLSR